MKNPPRPCPELLLAFLTLLAGPMPAALAPGEWPHRQALEVTAPGLVTAPLPPATFDSAQPGLTDLRILDPEGREVAYLLDAVNRDPTPPPASVRPQTFEPTSSGDNLQILIETGVAAPLSSLELETPAPFFLKAVHVDISADGQEWQSLGPTLPLFRQFGAEQLHLPLGGQRAAFIRVTLDDYLTRPVRFTGGRLFPVGGHRKAIAPITVPAAAPIVQRSEFAGETVLTVSLPARNLPLASLALDISDPLFMRRVTVAVREMQGSLAGERTLATGTLYRVALAGAPVRAQLDLPLEFTPDTRELLVHIHNGDSPPLEVKAVEARFHEVNLRFHATSAGRHMLLSGNAQAGPAHYDLAAVAGDLRKASSMPVAPGPIEAAPDYRPRETLAGPALSDVLLAGAPLDASDWAVRRSIRMERPGVQELELDPAALAGARSDGADLRLLRGDRQIPYLLEQPALARSLVLEPSVVVDPKRPGVSVWRIDLPQAGLPLRRVVLGSRTPLFSRQFRLFEKLTTAEGRRHEPILASGGWSRTGEPGEPETRVFDLSGRLAGNTLWIEADNGDNPPITLDAVQAVYPVVRLVFKSGGTDGYALAYGNSTARAPHYDLSLVAVKLLAVTRNEAQLATGGSSNRAPALPALNGRYFFWGALAFVVSILLAIIAKLLPEPPKST
ncbi:MAG TPA: DUF3999 family protein [Lacunisphaera sp.]|nr:DUF3999 family protein [Lacunisphaera sp.]